MNWHSRFLQQAAWTSPLRDHLFAQAGLPEAQRVLEVGCGTGAVLGSVRGPGALFGLDLDPEALNECRAHVPSADLVRADAHDLPFPDQFFDIAYCHFLLLWVRDPLRVVREMARVARCVIAFAEPDHTRRVDQPASLSDLGRRQTAALAAQGADPSMGARLPGTFFEAGLEIVEAGPMRGGEVLLSLADWEAEWAVLAADLGGSVPAAELRRLEELDREARRAGRRVLQVPTHFAWGRSRRGSMPEK